MKVIYSYEMHGFPGNAGYTAVLLRKQWTPVSGIFGSKHIGTDHFLDHLFMRFVVKVASDAVIATFRRDGDGNETVETDDGLNFDSFEAANRWAAEGAPYTCPLCGALLEEDSTK